MFQKLEAKNLTNPLENPREKQRTLAVGLLGNWPQNNADRESWASVAWGVVRFVPHTVGTMGGGGPDSAPAFCAPSGQQAVLWGPWPVAAVHGAIQAAWSTPVTPWHLRSGIMWRGIKTSGDPNICPLDQDMERSWEDTGYLMI